MKNDDLEPHRKYLRQVSAEDRSRRRAYYKLAPTLKETLPIVCLRATITAKDQKWRKFIHPLDPVSLDDLKNWFGVPNHLARRRLTDFVGRDPAERRSGPLASVDKRLLPAKRGFVFERLKNEQRQAVQQMSRNLLYTKVADEDLRDPQVSAVVESMISIAKMRRPPIIVIPDLIVCPDDNIVFDKISVVLLNNVIIYGNGQITTIGHTKFDAFHIQHVD